MRMPQLRFRLWMLLIAVAVAGAALGGWQIWKKRNYCLRISKIYDEILTEELRQVARYIDDLESPPATIFVLGPVEDDRLFWKRQLHFHRTNAENARIGAARCRHVARYPWLPMPSGYHPLPPD